MLSDVTKCFKIGHNYYFVALFTYCIELKHGAFTTISELELIIKRMDRFGINVSKLIMIYFGVFCFHNLFSIINIKKLSVGYKIS